MDLFLFDVPDDAMIGDRILKGDTVLIQCTEEVESHDIVLIADPDPKLRQIAKVGRQFTLTSSNPKVAIETRGSVSVIGKVVRLFVRH